MPTASQITSLLSNETLARLERLRIHNRHGFTDKRRGEHLSGRGGNSNEFSDFRDYVAGDDVRFVDWNAFARLNRPYLKLYHEEEEMNVVLLIDASSSMMFDGKFARSCQLAAAFGAMGLHGGERVSAYVFNSKEEAPLRLPACGGRASIRKLFAFLEGIEGGGDAPLEKGIEQFLKRHRGRGVVLALSDFLTFGDLHKGLNRLFSSGLETFAIQILSPAEISPDVSGDSRLVDCETGAILDVTANAHLMTIYHEYRQDFERTLAEYCQKRSGRFTSISSSAPLESLLFDHLWRQGWLK
ncbi:MAG: hypothetical protein ACI8W8_002441 [Rhodothermales bacterium]